MWRVCSQIAVILLIALAYSSAILQGQKIKRMGIQKYVGHLTEPQRSQRRHSSFWIGLYGQSWVVGMEFCQDIIAELMRIRRNIAFLSNMRCSRGHRA